ncbi:flavodoxin family protein [Brevibacillus dissolubilis]|uniref:flavodoxin family protein n=1 Tax=Brevibacillus dissolubilis TaxID=1844116 RepID=UPI001116D744|nr:flavodoxin family protein [Brevibacillus dissolubilis]
MSIFALYASSRPNGNSEQLTDMLLEGTVCTKIILREKNIRPITDQRHTPEGFRPVDDDYDAIVEEMMRHDVLIFSTPLYWYGMSGPMKDFVDRWSQSLRDKRYHFKEEMSKKQVYVVITGGDHPRVTGLPLVQQFQHIFRFMGMNFAGYIIGEGNQPGDVLQDERAVSEAKWLNHRLRGSL